jgi:hypothetical protein
VSGRFLNCPRGTCEVSSVFLCASAPLREIIVRMADVMSTDTVVAFYSGGVDNRRRTLEELWSWSDDRLEAVHDYIQWMFPTVQPSGVNPFAPQVTRQTIEAFESDPLLRDRLRRSLDRMLSFYGLRRVAMSGADDRIEIDPARFADRAAGWLHPGNHNHCV